MKFILEFKHLDDGTFQVHHNRIERNVPRDVVNTFGWQPVCVFESNPKVESILSMVEEVSNGDVKIAMGISDILRECGLPITPWDKANMPG